MKTLELTEVELAIIQMALVDTRRDLNKLVRKSIVNYLLRMLRGPAHAAGFGKLQEFLETGLASFRALEDADYFVETIYRREWRAMEKLFAEDPDPFRLPEIRSRSVR